MQQIYKRKQILATIVFPSIFFCARVFSQQEQYIFKHLTTENGLISNHVGTVFQDCKGYIWIASIDGLQRYDGSRFINYVADLHDPNALHNNIINTVFEDSKHRFWIGTYASPYLLNTTTGKFYNYNIHRLKDATTVFNIAKFTEDRKGDIWAINNKSYYKLNNSTNQFEDMAVLAGLDAGATANFLDRDYNGNIWFVSSVGIICYNPLLKKRFYRKYNPLGWKIFDTDIKITNFLVSGDNIFFSTNRSRVLYKFNFASNAINAYQIKDPVGSESLSKNFSIKIDNIYQTKNGIILIAMSGEGVALVGTTGITVSEIVINNNNQNGLHGSPELFSGISLFEDIDSNIWIGTNKGLNIFNPGKKRFYYYGRVKSANPGDVLAYMVSGIIQDSHNNDIYVSYYYPTGGILKLTKDFKVKQQYLIKKHGDFNLAENQVWCMFLDNDGIIWAPNQAKSILKLDTKTGKLSIAGDSGLYGNINLIQKDANGDIWIGTWGNGLKKIDYHDHRVSSFIQSPEGCPMVPKNVTSLYFESDSIIWVGTNESGFYKFNRQVGKYTDYFLFNEASVGTISSNTILRILPYKNDTLILATNAGLNFFNKRTRAFSQVTSKEGLPVNIVENIEMDDQQNLWVACNGGFSKINMQNMLVTNFGVSDGVTDNAFTSVPFLKMKDGRYLVPGSKGFMSFNPADITNGHIPPDPVITSLTVFDKQLQIDSLLNSSKPLKLTYKENNLFFEFSSLQFNVADKLKYYYQMSGIDKGWIVAGSEQAVHYNQLECGKYIFKVKTVNRDGLAAANEASLIINIELPFWRTWWFFLFEISLAAGSIFYLSKKAEKRRKEKEKLSGKHAKEIAAVEMKTLRAQMSPHFISNSLTSINSLILKNDTEIASEYLTKFSRLMRMILDNSRNEWVMLEKELAALELYIEMEALRFENIFNHKIVIDENIRQLNVLIPPLIIQPYVENAIWHGLLKRDKPGGNLVISIRKDKRDIIIIIEDDGIGRAKAAVLNKENNNARKSHGLIITQERLNIVNDINRMNAKVGIEDLTDSLGNPSGTRVFLTIQLIPYAGNYN